MDQDIINIFHLFFIFVFFTSIFSYAIYSIKQLVRSFNFQFVKKVYCQALNFWKLMMRKDYISFEKYEIWRFCVEF